MPTPIGNLEDITIRALRILKEVQCILSEDTRSTSILLKHYDIHTPLQSFHAHNEHHILQSIINRLKQGEVMALVTDAGTPGISDPGFLLARECLRENIKFECLPGPTAFVPALIKSALPADSFVFEGFLPQKKGRLTKLKSLEHERRTMIFYESPHRLLKLLHELQSIMGPDRNASVSRELTKVYEETINGTLLELISLFSEKPVKGEIVVCVEGKRKNNTNHIAH